MNLGGLDEEMGDLADAEAAFRAALQCQPTFALPYARLATLLGGKLPGADLAELEGRLGDSTLEAGPRARLLFALAHVHDGRGDYQRAADCLREANAQTLQQNFEHKRAYVPEDHERFVDKILETFGSAFFARTGGAGLRTRRPVFVFGLPRSGTTLVEQILASHSRIHGAGELRMGRQSFESIPSVLGRSDAPLTFGQHVDAGAIGRLAQQHDDRLGKVATARAERVVDKMPDNYLYLGLLAAMFPDATFIHCRRDLRDVALSCWMTDFRSIRWANDVQHIASRFRQYRRLMEHWRAVLPVPVHEIHYEQAVANLESVARGLIAACALEWEHACLQFHRTRRPIRTASVAQVRQPIYQRSIGRWRQYEHFLADLFSALPPKEEPSL
jgi:tetratricopeptide (TPR) repeat protein